MSHGPSLSPAAPSGAVGSLVIAPVSPAAQGEGGCSGWGMVGSASSYSFGCFSLYTEPVLAQLERGNFFSSAITKHCFFPSVHDAVLHISGEQRQTLVSTQPRRPRDCDGRKAAKPTLPCLSPLGGPQHQDVVPQEEDVSPRSRVGEEGFATLMAPTHPPQGPEASYPHQPLRTLRAGALPRP